MEFSSLLFLFCLLPLTVLGYFLLPDVGRRNIFLIAISLLLYGLCQPVYIPLLLILCRINYKLSFRIRKNKRILLFGLTTNLGTLLLLKYLDPVLLAAGIGGSTGGVLFGIVASAVAKLNEWGMNLALPSSLAPLGLSFFVLTAISYLVDVYRGKHPPERSYKLFLLYMLLFFRVFQGPLVRYEQIGPSLKVRKDNYRLIFDGAVRFATGLGKKVLIGDFVFRLIEDLALSGSDQALFGGWLRPVLVLFWVYFDFSGCCDMAVGLGKVFGFRLPDNFGLPFTAMSVTEFFEGWNLTVRAFFTDYVYQPLRDRKNGQGSPLAAGFAALMLMCLWHGGTFNFLLLGLYLGCVMLLEDQFQDFFTDLPYWLRHTLTFVALIFAAVLFDNPDSASIAAALKAMIGEGGAVVPGDGSRFLNAVPLLALCWLAASEAPKRFRMKWKAICGIIRKDKNNPVHPMMPKIYAVSCLVYILLILWLSTVARIGTPVVESVFMGL